MAGALIIGLRSVIGAAVFSVAFVAPGTTSIAVWVPTVSKDPVWSLKFSLLLPTTLVLWIPVTGS